MIQKTSLNQFKIVDVIADISVFIASDISVFVKSFLGEMFFDRFESAKKTRNSS